MCRPATLRSMSTDRIDDQLIKKYNLEKHLREIEISQEGKFVSHDLKENQKKRDPIETIKAIFGDMKVEQLLLYAANLLYRYKICSSAGYSPDTSDISPPKQDERVALSLGVVDRFKQEQYHFLPDVEYIIEVLDKRADPFTQSSDFYFIMMAATGRLVHDKRGFQWMLAPKSRLAIGQGEIAEFHPQIWMIIQDAILEFLSAPQLAELFVNPISPKNGGEVLRRQRNPSDSFKLRVKQEILRRCSESIEKAANVSDQEINFMLKKLIHQYKLDIHKLKLGETEDI